MYAYISIEGEGEIDVGNKPFKVVLVSGRWMAADMWSFYVDID